MGHLDSRGPVDSVSVYGLQDLDAERGSLDFTPITVHNLGQKKRHPKRQGRSTLILNDAKKAGLRGPPPRLSQAALNRKAGLLNPTGTPRNFDGSTITQSGYVPWDRYNRSTAPLFGKVLKPYKSFINRSRGRRGIWFDTRFGTRKLHKNRTGLYIKASRRKFYLHRW